MVGLLVPETAQAALTKAERPTTQFTKRLAITLLSNISPAVATHRPGQKTLAALAPEKSGVHRHCFILALDPDLDILKG